MYGSRCEAHLRALRSGARFVRATEPPSLDSRASCNVEAAGSVSIAVGRMGADGVVWALYP